MYDITDITILIAVIALALWPVILFVIKFMHERRLRLEHLEKMTQEELDDVKTSDMVISVLKKIGCQPEVNEEGHISFKYQGDDFYITAEDESRYIMIWNPWWGTISADNPALPYLKEFVNLANVNSLVTTVCLMDEDEKSFGLHSRCHTFFTPAEGELDEHLKMLLDLFFDTHKVIKEYMEQLGKAEAETEEKDKERITVKGFAAYKDNPAQINGSPERVTEVEEASKSADTPAVSKQSH